MMTMIRITMATVSLAVTSPLLQKLLAWWSSKRELGVAVVSAYATGFWGRSYKL